MKKVSTTVIFCFFKKIRGLILNEIFRRKDPLGRTIGEWLDEEVINLIICNEAD